MHPHRALQEFAARCFPPASPHKLQLLRGPGASNVVLKDFCLAGAHPGHHTQEIVANLTPLLRAGVTTFVCLQPEMPVPGVAHPSLRRDPSRTIAATGACTRCAVASRVSHLALPHLSAHILHVHPAHSLVAAKPYIADAQAIVDSGGGGGGGGPSSFPQARANGGAALSFLHYPIPEHGPAVLPDAALAALCLELVSFMRAGA